MKADTLFTSEEKETIAATIAGVEKKTAGEVAVMVVDESDSYPESLVISGVLLGGLSGLLLTDLFFHDSLWLFLSLSSTSIRLSGYIPATVHWFMNRISFSFTRSIISKPSRFARSGR